MLYGTFHNKQTSRVERHFDVLGVDTVLTVGLLLSTHTQQLITDTATEHRLKYNFQGGGTVQLSGPPLHSPIHFLGPCFNSNL